MPGQKPSNSQIRILHADDESDFAELAATFVEREDDRFDIELATSASEGLEYLAEADFDCIISDYDMPGENGIDFLDIVREEHPDLPFILYTGKGSEEIASNAIAAGVTDYLQKTRGTSQYTVLANRIGNAVEQYQSKRWLQDSQQRLSLFFEQSPLGVIEWDENFHIAHLNETAEDILGYTEREVRGDSWERIVPESDGQAVAEVVTELLDAKGGYHSINRNVRKNGDEIICEWHNRVISDERGDVVAIFSQFQDVTNRQTEKRKLGRTNAVLSTLFEALPVGVLAEDTERNVLAANDQLFDLFDISGSPDEAVGADCEALAAQISDLFVDADEFVERIEKRVTERTLTDDEELRLRDGRTFERSYRPTELPTGSGHLWVYRDTTDRKEREHDLERERDRLNEFASVVSHDLRSPLNVAEGHIELLSEECDSTHLSAIERAFGRMDDLVDDLLQLARSGKRIGDKGPVDIGSLSEDCWQNVVTADASMRTATDRIILADWNRFQQLLENLLRNAVEHGGDDVTVTVGDLDDGFYVADNGPGIPEEDRERVFGAGHSTAANGTGFGLSIVEQVADGHGWEIDVTDSSGGGARFEFVGVESAR